MVTTTGIELGPDSCVLAGVRPARGALQVMALHVIEPFQWPDQNVTLTATLHEARTTKRFPRRARVIAWGLPEGATRDDPHARAMLGPLTAAGFHIEAVMTPPQALALLAASRQRTSAGGSAVAWLALNTRGAAIAIVRGGELLFSRTFDWTYNTGAATSKDSLLQRYLLVAHLAPEVRRGISIVRTSHGAIVENIVTCGDLPELRSLTMPLIEELDLEVETLDSTEGLTAVGGAKAERFAEVAPVIRLACAVAAARIPRPRRAEKPLAAVAATIAVVGALGWGAYAYWKPSPVQPVAPPTAGASVSPPATRSQGTPPGAAPTVAGQPQVTPPVSATSRPAGTMTSNRQPPPAVTSPSQIRTVAPVPAASPSTAAGQAPKSTAPVAAPTNASQPPARRPAAEPVKQPVQAPTTAPPVQRPVTPPPATPAEPLTARPVASPSPMPIVASSPGPVDRGPQRAIERPTAMPVTPPVSNRIEPGPQMPLTGAPARSAPAKRLVPLKQPLPRVESILIDQERRLAIVDGAIVRVGDAVGPRVVTLIDQEGVVFREPSGLTVRVSLRAGGTDGL
jgi:hypothetical protein